MTVEFKNHDLAYWMDDDLRAAHGFFTRMGGISEAPIEGLNCGYGADEPCANVDHNRALVADVLGTRRAIERAHQIHSADVITVSEPFAQAPKADALVTNIPGLAISVLTADCAPILFADDNAGIVGAAHAGWRGAFAGIPQNTINAMVKLGAKRENIRALVGPCISMQNYEVGQEFVETFTDENPNHGQYFSGSDSIHFNLPRFVLDQIRDGGIDNCEWVGACTYAEPEKYYSYRRGTHLNEIDYGRLIAAIMVPERIHE